MASWVQAASAGICCLIVKLHTNCTASLSGEVLGCRYKDTACEGLCGILSGVLKIPELQCPELVQALIYFDSDNMHTVFLDVVFWLHPLQALLSSGRLVKV